jgi:CRP-like cAMP-binding protein
MARRIRQSTQRAEALGTLAADGRFVYQAVSLAQQYGRWHDEDIVIPLRITQTDWAHLVGTSREWINKTMQYYKRQGVISSASNHYLRIHDFQALIRRYNSFNPKWKNSSLHSCFT